MLGNNFSVPFVFWNKKTSQPLHLISCLASGECIVTGSESGELCIWTSDLSPGIICTVPYRTQCRALAFVPTPAPRILGCAVWVVSVHSDCKIRIWDTENGRCVRVIEPLAPGDVSGIYTLRSSILGVSIDSELFLVDIGTGEVTSRLKFDDRVCGVFYGDSKLVAIERNSTVLLWEGNFADEPTGKLNIEATEDAKGIVGSKDGNLLVVQYTNSVLFFHKSWVYQKNEHYFTITFRFRVLFIGFSDVEMMLVLENSKVYRYVIQDLLEFLQIYRNNADEHMEGGFRLEYTSTFVEGPLGLSTIKERTLFTTDKSSIFTYTLNKFGTAQKTRPEVHPFDRNLPSHLYADCIFHQFRMPQDTVTASTMAMIDRNFYYILGTVLGSVIAFKVLDPSESIPYAFHCSSVTCLYASGHKLVSCDVDLTLCIWDLKQGYKKNPQTPGKFSETVVLGRKMSRTSTEKRIPTQNEIKAGPIKIIKLKSSCVAKIINVQLLEDTVSLVNKGFWKSSWKSWSQSLLAQREDGTVLLISLNSNSIISEFSEALPSIIKEAQVHLMLEYLLVTCEDTKVYILNMVRKALERVTSSSELSEFIKKPRKKSKKRSQPPMTSSFNKVLMESMACKNSNDSPYYIESIEIGETKHTAAVLNLDLLVKEDSKDLSKYLLSLLSCNMEGCPGFTLLKNSIEQFPEITIKASPGTVGVGHCYSFLLPSERNPYEISSHFMSTLLPYESLFVLDSIREGKTQVKVHSIHEPDLITLGILTLKNNEGAKILLKTLIKRMDLNTKLEVINDLIVPLDFFGNQVYSNNELLLIEVLAATVVGFVLVKLPKPSLDLKDKLLPFLKVMVKTEEWVGLAIEILAKGMVHWKPLLNERELIDIIRIMFCHVEVQSEVSYRALINTALAGIQPIMKVLKEDLVRLKSYPFEFLTRFIQGYFEEAGMFLHNIVTLILESLLRLEEESKGKAEETLSLIYANFSTVDYNSAKSKLAVGTVDHEVYIYDLKNPDRYRVLNGHEAPISAVAFNQSGQFLASYSSQDLTIQIWNLNNWIKEMLNQPNKVINLEEVEPTSVTYKQLMMATKLRWEGSSLFLTREDAKEYIFSID